MFIKQISVFLENKRGSLRVLTDLLGKNAIDLLAVSIADTKNFGIVRFVVRSEECARAMDLLKEAGFSTRANNVICVAVPDRPMGLAEVLALLDENDLFIEYTYSFVRGRENFALIILRLSEQDEAVKKLAEKGVKLVSQQEIDRL